MILEYFTLMKKADALKLLFLIPVTVFLLIIAAKRPSVFYGDIFRENTRISKETTVNLNPMGLNGQEGKAFLNEVSGRLVIKLRLEGGEKDTTQSAFIYNGNCGNLDGVRYYIAPTYEGKSTSTYYGLDVNSLKKDLPLSIVVSKSLEEHGEIVSCGGIEI
jgi:hypothetical protein